MKKRFAAMLLLTAAVSFGGFFARVAAEQQALASKMIRLHVVAASDRAEDQSLKLRVRDRLLPVIAEATAPCTDAEAALRQALPSLQAAASAAAEGQTVTVQLGRESFPRRVYDSFSLPAGDYTALRVILGPGQGHNWWCVAFPALCLPAAQEEAEEVSAGFDREDRELMHDDSPRTELKFRCLEWLREVFG